MKISLLSVSFVATLAACGSLPTPSTPGSSLAPLPASAPAWVSNAGKHPSYPSALWITAVGAAVAGEPESKDRAIQDGRKKISEQLNSKVEGVTDSLLREVAAGDEYSASYDYAQNIRNQTESLLFGSRAVDEYSVAGTSYVLVALNREEHSEALFNNVDAELAKVESEGQSSAAGALRALIREHVTLEELVPTLVTVGLVLPKGHPSRSEFDQRWNAVTARLQDVLRRYRDQEVTLRAVQGGGQRGELNRMLETPLVFEATAAGKPLVGFPVSFSLEHPGRAELVQSDGQTDRDGRFSTSVTGIQLTGDEENEVYAALDFASLGEATLAAPKTASAFVLPTLQSATFSIAVTESNVGQELKESAVRAALEAALTKRRVKNAGLRSFLSEADAAAATRESPTWLRERLTGKVDYLIRGTARSEFEGKSRVVYCCAGGDFELIDVRTGELIAAYEVPLSSGNIKKAGKNEQDAGARALRELSRGVEAELMGKIDEIFARP